MDSVNLLIIALSNFAMVLLTAWVIQRFTTGRSVIPSLPRKVENGEDVEHEVEPARGRPIL